MGGKDGNDLAIDEIHSVNDHQYEQDVIPLTITHCHPPGIWTIFVFLPDGDNISVQ